VSKPHRIHVVNYSYIIVMLAVPTTKQLLVGS